MKDFVLTRKKHKCDYCERIISSKSKMQLHEGKSPNYDENENQIGIEYYRGYTCYDDPLCKTKEDIELENECKSMGHNYIEMEIPVSIYPEDGSEKTGIFYCEHCNKQQANKTTRGE